MVKLRVYELAKELKLDNKELVRQLINMGLDVRNHMSILSPEEAQFVRERLRISRSEVIEEMRVTTRVIRRRRRFIESDIVEEGGQDEETHSLFESSGEVAIEQQSIHDDTFILKELVQEEPTQAAIPLGVIEKSVRVEIPSETTSLSRVTAVQTQLENSKPVIKNIESSPAIALLKHEQLTAVVDTAVNLSSKATTATSSSSKFTIRASRSADVPARIISRPVMPSISSTIEPRRAERKIGRSEGYISRSRNSILTGLPTDVLTTPGKVDERRRRKKSKKTVTVQDDDHLMNKTTNRRKEILDKIDLYGDTRNARIKRKNAATKRSKKTELTTPKAIKRRIKVGEAIVVGELAKRMGIKATELVMRLIELGIMATVNQAMDVDEASLVANEFGFEVERIGFEEGELLEQIIDQPEDLVSRSPVVTIMGHVDHGKTSLLDAIRRSNIVSAETGGITQHIGAYNVRLPNGGQVVFVDTPGHEAFAQMRARGAQITDVVVLVVSADDGVMQQTKEAINHSRAAKVPLVVAINKIDKTGADPDRVRRELADQGLVPEIWGGDTIMVEVSAKTGHGLDQLLEMLLLQSEILELKANPKKPARGRILEARLDKGRGAIATVIVLEGTLKMGEQFICGVYAGKVRALFDDLGRRLDEAGPSIPVEVQGFSGVPEVGDEFVVVESEKVARSIAEHRGLKKREAELNVHRHMNLEGFFDQMKEGSLQELKLVVKADVQGSVEALIEALNKLGTEQVRVNVIHAAAGAITETDVMLASASQAIIIGFNVRPSIKASEVAETERVDIRTYDIIYQVIDEIRAALTGLLAPIFQEENIGRAEVRQVFSVPKLGIVVGCIVTFGKIERNAHARLLRDGTIVTISKIYSLRRFKDDVKEVLQGFECGISLENYNDIKIGDEIETFAIKEVAAEL